MAFLFDSNLIPFRDYGKKLPATDAFVIPVTPVVAPAGPVIHGSAVGIDRIDIIRIIQKIVVVVIKIVIIIRDVAITGITAVQVISAPGADGRIDRNGPMAVRAAHGVVRNAACRFVLGAIRDLGAVGMEGGSVLVIETGCEDVAAVRADVDIGTDLVRAARAVIMLGVFGNLCTGRWQRYSHSTGRHRHRR